MEGLKEILKIRNNLLKYLRKRGRGKNSFNLMDAIILSAIKKNPDISGKDFKREMDIDSAYITRDISKLKEKNLIEKKRIGRKNLLKLTRSGDMVAEKMIGESDDFIEELCCNVGREDVETAFKVVKEVNRMIEEKLT